MSWRTGCTRLDLSKGKNGLGWANMIFWAYSQSWPLFTYSSSSSCEILEKSLKWISKKKKVWDFWPNLGYKFPILGSKWVFSNYSLSSPLFKYSTQWLYKLSKKFLKWNLRKSCARIWGYLRIKYPILGSKRVFFLNIHYCYLCLLVVPNHHAKVKNNH